MEAHIAAARGHEPCPNCGSADVSWRGRRWWESLRRALANAIEWPFTVLASTSRTPSLTLTRQPTQRGVDASQYWRLRKAYDSRVAALPPRIWQCRACDRRGEIHPGYAAVRAEYEPDLARLEGGMSHMTLPDKPISRLSETTGDQIPDSTDVTDGLLR